MTAPSAGLKKLSVLLYSWELCQPPPELVQVTFGMITGMWPSDSQHPGQQPLTLMLQPCGCQATTTDV